LVGRHGAIKPVGRVRFVNTGDAIEPMRQQDKNPLDGICGHIDGDGLDVIADIGRRGVPCSNSHSLFLVYGQS
jgi:hypothetical protein